jgi:hypothetical protein
LADKKLVDKQKISALEQFKEIKRRKQKKQNYNKKTPHFAPTPVVDHYSLLKSLFDQTDTEKPINGLASTANREI